MLARVLSAAAMITGVALGLFGGPAPFFGVLGGVCVLAAAEWSHLCAHAPRSQKMPELSGLALIFFFFTSFALLRTISRMQLLAVVWTCDCVALFVGRNWKEPRFPASINADKSLTAAVAALVAGTCVSFAMGMPAAAAIATPLGAVIGDAAQSWCKRRSGLKDTNFFITIPGHGGILDRIDALLLATPLFVMFA